MNTEEQTTAETHTELRAKCDQCHQWFKNHRALQTHKARKHGQGWSTHGNFGKKKVYPSSTKAYRRRQYIELKNFRRSQGLTAQGKPFKNGAAVPQQEPKDNLGESARAIIMAAQVLRSVSVGMKL